jgi:hypothetical protein
LLQAGLPAGLFKLERILVSTEEFSALYRGIAEAGNDPATGLKLGIEERVEGYDPIRLAALSARSFRDAIERTKRYKQLTCPEEIRVVERVDECAVQFVWVLAYEQEPPLLVDTAVQDNRPPSGRPSQKKGFRTGSSGSQGRRFRFHKFVACPKSSQ